MSAELERAGCSSALQLPAVVEEARDAIVALDPDGHVTAWNRGATEVYGYRAEEVIGRHYSIVDQSSTGEVNGLIARALAGETVREHIGVRRRKHGTLIDISTTYTPIKSADGAVVAISVVGRDVTEIRTAQRRAEETAHDLDIIVNSASEAIYRLDEHAQVVFANAAAGRLFGARPEELVGLKMHGAHHHTRPNGTPYPEEECPIVQAVATGETVRLYAELFFRIDGTPFHADVTITGACASGEVSGAVVILSDVSDRLLAEETAREAMVRFESAFRDASIGMALIDLRPDQAGEYLAVNDSLCEILQRPANEIVGQRCRQFAHPDDTEPIRVSIEELVAGGNSQAPSRIRYIAADGTVVWTLRTASVVRDTRTPYAILQIQDVTDQVRAEHELRASERRYRSLIDAANEGVWAVDLDGKTTFANEPMGAILGVAAHELNGRRPQDMAVDSRVVDAAMDRLLAGETVRLETVLQHADGRAVPALVSAAPITDADGRVTGALAMVVDLSDRVQAEAEKQLLQEQLHQSQKLETVGQLAGGIAHDFNNILSVILNYAHFAASAMEGHPARGDVVEISRAAERAAELTQQLLVFSRKGDVTKERLDVNEVIVDFETLLKRAVGYHVLVGLTLAPDLPKVLVNRGQLEQVLLNLAVNAGDAMPEAGTLEIATARTADGFVRIAVADTGTGMAPGVRERAFEPFYTTKPEGAGTGLGLAMAYGMVTEAGGRIDIASTPGAGTTVTIDLPPAHDSATGLPPTATSRDVPAKAVLVVEDEPSVRRLTVRILSEAGYDVSAAAQANEALELLQARSGAFDLVVTDVVMPDMSGTTLAARVQECWPGVAVLFMSGYREHSQRVPPDAHLVQKPFTATQLLQEVAQLIGRVAA